MKTTIFSRFSTAAVAASASFALLAIAAGLLAPTVLGQKNVKPDSDPREGRTKSASSPKKSEALRLDGTAEVKAELGQTLDVRRAQVGDAVVLRATKAVKQGGQTVIAKGARLTGRITEIARAESSRGESRIGLLIDRIREGGVERPVSVAIISIVDARAAAGVGDMSAGVDSTAGSTVAASSAGSGRSGSGGLLGQTAGTVGGVVNSATGAVAGTARGVVDTSASAVGEVVSGTARAAGGVATTANGAVSGLRITQSANASGSGGVVLSSPGKELRLEKGLVFNLAVSNSVEKSGQTL
jgi:hypothetical protein